MARSVCVCCGKQITWQYDLCVDCETKYKKQCEEQDKSYPPKWLKFLTNESQKKRRRTERQAVVEVSLEDQEVFAAAEAKAAKDFLRMINNPGYVSRIDLQCRPSERKDIPLEVPNSCVKRKALKTCKGCDWDWWCGEPD